jgi:hypothetical protein
MIFDGIRVSRPSVWSADRSDKTGEHRRFGQCQLACILVWRHRSITWQLRPQVKSRWTSVPNMQGPRGTLFRFKATPIELSPPPAFAFKCEFLSLRVSSHCNVVHAQAGIQASWHPALWISGLSPE